jgi:DNA mismatch repair ATPase MutS
LLLTALLHRSSGKGKTQTWTLARAASPGNLQHFEDVLYTSGELSTAGRILAAKVALVDGHRLVGASFADLTASELLVVEFAETDEFAAFEALLVQVGARELLLPAEAGEGDTGTDLGRMAAVAARAGVAVTRRRKADFHTRDVAEDLGRLLKGGAAAARTRTELELNHAMASTAALVAYLDLLANEDHFAQFRLGTFDLSQYMKLDAAAARALNLLPTPGAAKNMSLCGLLDKCKVRRDPAPSSAPTD